VVTKRVLVRAAIASTITLSFLLSVVLVGGCIDGTTPDCSSATSGCAPDLDGTVGIDAPDAPDAVHADAPPADTSTGVTDGATKDVAADGGRDAKDG
jgi:hypothetical protein